MYCIICGEKGDFPLCDSCSKDEKKINSHLRNLFKKDPWFPKLLAFKEPDQKAKLYSVPEELAELATEMVQEQRNADKCYCAGVFGVYRDKNGDYVVHKSILEAGLNCLQEKFLVLSIAKHFEQQAEIEK